jgi:outer membrane protein insertion porin family
MSLFFKEGRQTGGGMVKAAGCGILFFGFLLLGSAVYAQQPARTTVQRIQVRKNHLEEKTILSWIVHTREGEPYDESNIEFDLRALYKQNYFENIEVTEEDGDIGKIITFWVKEKPRIHEVFYAGNSSLKEDNIRTAFHEKKIGVSTSSYYDPAKIRMAERVLKELMVESGKPLGVVHTEIETVAAGVNVRFIMQEGRSARIGEIDFSGPKIFSDKELKNSLKLTKEHSLLSMFKGADKYHKEKLEYDIDSNLKAFYQDRGYMQVQTGSPITRIFNGPRGMIPLLRKTRDQFFIEIPIEAGDQYRIGKLELTGCEPLYKCDDLLKAFPLKEGDIVKFKSIRDTVEQIKKQYGKYGYINFSYTAKPNVDQKKKTYDLTLNLNADKQYLVDKIWFLGNVKTKDIVLRREFILQEMMIFSSTALDSSIARLNRLGIFDRIEEKDYEIKLDETKGMVTITVNVKEKSQRSIGFSGGVSGISGSFIGVNYSDNNFLGRGESVELNVMGGTRTTDFIFSFSEPHLFDTLWNTELRLFNRRYRYDSYSSFGLTSYSGAPAELFTQKTLGTTLSLNRPFKRLWSFGGSYTYERIGISDIAAGLESYALNQFAGLTPSNQVTDALKGIIRSEFTPSVSYLSLDHPFLTSRGTSFQFSTAVAGGILGGDFNMFRPILEYRHYFPDKWLISKHNVFAFRFLGEYIQSFGNSSVPFFDRFFIGGENDIRGFDIRSISPIAITSTRMLDVNGNPVINLKTGLPMVSQSAPFPVGGDMAGIFNFEYRMPVAGPLSLALFYDMGMVRAAQTSSLKNFGASHSDIEIIGSTNHAIRASTGLELQFVLPMIGAPFRLIFAYNPQRVNTSITTTNSLYRINEPNHDIKFTVGHTF